MSKLAAGGLFLLTAVLSLNAQVPLITSGATWKYLDNGVDQGTTWVSPGFSDGSWASGPSPLGYSTDGDTLFATTNSYGGVDTNKFPTYYYRHTFNLAVASTVTNLQARVRRDDGIVAYLNGTEVFRDNMPTGAVVFTTFATGAASDDGDFFHNFNVSGSLLVNGNNVLAVEMHQNNATSTDLVFDLALDGNPLPQIAITSPTNGQVLAAVNVPISVSASPGGQSIVKVEFFQAAVKLGESTTAPYNFFWQSVVPGAYSLTARLTDSSGLTATSAPVNITVQAIPASTLVTRQDTWKYNDLNADLGTAWRALDYNDASWLSGPGPLGAGDTWIRTTVNQGATTRTPTIYLRKTIQVANPSAYVSLVMNLMRDDGAAVYLNGAEVLLDGVASQASFAEWATQTVGDPNENAYFQYIVPTTALVQGNNILAVMVKNVSATSSDLGFDLEVIGDLVPRVSLTSPSQGAVFTKPANVTVTADAVDDGGSITGVSFLDGADLIRQLSTPPFSFVWSNALDGAHTLRAIAVDNTGNSVTSAPVSITVVDPNPPTLVSATATTNELTVVFSKRITPASANNTNNYAISNQVGVAIPVLSATLSEAGNSVVLGTGPMSEGQTYTLTVNNIESVDEQFIAPNSRIQFTIQQFIVANIGSPPIPGSQVPAAGGLNITGSGTNILGVSDQFVFSYVERADDFDLEIRLDDLTAPNAWAKAGLMARDSLAANSRFAASLATPSVAGSFFESRAVAGNAATTAGYFPVSYPNTWLRLRRTADLFVGYASSDGQNWSELGRVSLPAAPRPMRVGVAITSASSSSAQGATVAVRNVNDATGDPTEGSAFAREPLGPSTRRGPLVISEIMYNPKNPKPTNGTPGSLEWLELYNSQAWDEDIGNYRISGAVDYTFPAGTTIKSGGFLVVARDKAQVEAFYGISGVMGPWEGASTNGLPNDGGLLRLRGRADEVLYEVNYLDHAPWPEAADGAGHSIVLARPSFGEDDPRAWAASDLIGGSPGRYDSLGPERLRDVVINEFLAHTDDPVLDFIELYNHSNQSVDITGAWLSDDPDTNKFCITSRTVLPAHGYVSYNQAQLGFALSSGGERIFLVNSNQTRVIDAVRFEGQANGVSTGRYPNGAPSWYELASRTPAQANGGPIIRDIVINEIMYSPISGDSIDEFVELYNKGEQAVNVGGWRFTDGIDFRIPPNTIIASNGYLVVAKSLTNMLAKYPQLNPQNTLGDYDGTLANGGERIALSMPDLVVATNESRHVLETNTIFILVDEVTYDDGGRWGWWSDGGGSSLELKDPSSDNRLASNWADSDESQKAPWTVIQGSAAIGEALGAANDRLIIYNPGGIGEFLLDDVEVVNFGGANSISANAGFENGAAGVTNLVPQGTSAPSNKWSTQGSHDHSLVSTQAFSGSYSLRVRAASRGDNGPNRVYSPLLSPAASGGAANPVTLKCKARWLRGWPEVLMLMKGDTMEIGGKLNLPSNLGSPGLPNPQAVNNAGPALWDVIHTPILPPANTPVTVTARAFDSDGISALYLKYRNDTAGGGFTSVTMVDNGNGGDAVIGDGQYAGIIPAQSSGVTVAFYLEAVDSRGTTNLFPQDVFPKPGENRVFPTDARTRELVVRWGDRIIPGSFANYRLWLTKDNTTRWNTRRPTLNNAVMDATFVYNNYRVIYNMKPQYAGSPWHRGQMTTGPDGNNRVDYDIEFPLDDRFLGENDAVWNYSGNPGGSGASDTSYQTEQTSYIMFKGLNIHYNYRRYVHIFVNGSQRSTIDAFPGQNSIMEDSQQPNGVTVREWFPDDTEGDLYKIEDEFWFPDDGQEFSGNDDADLGRRNIPGTQDLQISAYRFAFRKRALDAGNSQVDYTSFENLVDIVSPYANPTSNPLENVESFYGIANPEQWMRIFAVQHAVGNWDAYGYNRGKNAYTYKPVNGRFDQWTWDIDFTMGVGGDGAGVNLFATTDQRITAMFGDGAGGGTPKIRRAYFRAWQDLIDGPWNRPYADPILDAKAAAMRANNVAYNEGTVTTIKNFITSARNALQSQLNAASVATTFAVNGPTTTNTSNNLIVLTGTAQVKVKDLSVNGVLLPVTWTDMKSWRLSFVAATGTNTYTVSGIDSQGAPVAGANQTITVGYAGPAADPAGTIVFNEVMYNPTVPNATFVEIFNTSPNVSFDISGWRINGLDFTFPVGSVLSNRQYLVLAKDLGAFSTAYGGAVPVAGVFDGNLDPDGETLTLIKPGANGDPDLEVDKFRYEPVAPWATTPNGTGPSLQLIDAEEDNSRASNWSDGIGWRFFRATGPGSSTANTLILAMNEAGQVYLDNIELVLGTQPGVGPNLLQNAGFETGTTNFWIIVRNHTNSVVTSDESYEGTYSLHVLATGSGSNGDYIQQRLPLTLAATNQYTLSFWYLPVQKNGLRYRVGTGIQAGWTTPFNGVDVSPAYSSPAKANAAAGSLPPYDPVWLNEVAPSNMTGLADSQGQFDPWIELYNAGPGPVTLDGYFLANNYKSNLTQWAFPTGITIAPNTFRIVWVDGEPGQTVGDELHASFRLNSSNGSVALVRLVTDTPQITDYLNYSGLRVDQSYGDYPDGQPFKRVIMTTRTPGAINIGKPADLYINEWMADNVDYKPDLADGNFEDWFELYNPGNETVDLTGYFLTDNLNNKNQFPIPAGYSIAPRGFLLVWADNDTDQNTNTAELHVNFALRAAGESIGLYAPNGVTMDEISFVNQATNISEGRLPDGSANLARFTNQTTTPPTPGGPNFLGGENTAPVLDPISDVTITLGQTLSIPISASDAEGSQSLTFSLPLGAPLGVNIAPTGVRTAQLTWTPKPDQAPSTNPITVRATDNGVPPLSDEESFTVTVLLPPEVGIGVANGQVTLSFATIPGKTYRILYADNLDEAPINWQQLGLDQVAAGTSLTIIDNIGAVPQRFYRVQQVN